jgi:hypothetical protein
MKKVKFTIIALVACLGLSSCSSDEMLMPEEQSKDLFNTYQLKRDANGAYSIDINVIDDVTIGKVKNATTNTNEFYLSNDQSVQKSNYGSDLWFNNESFKIELISDNSSEVPSISITDDNNKNLQKTDSELLKEYSISLNEDGSYDLDFKVLNKTSVQFIQDKVNDIYEVHLEESSESQESNSYVRTFEKLEGELLQIHFVNHSSGSAKGNSMGIRRPIIIVDNGSD